MAEYKIMPHNLESEQAVLGCVLIDSQTQADIFPQIHEDDFYSESHQSIYRAMLKVYQKNIPVDFVTLADQLENDKLVDKVGGFEYLTDLSNAVPSAANYQYYCDIVKGLSLRRKLINGGQKIIEEAFNQEDQEAAMQFSEKTIFDLAEKQDRSSLEHVGKPGGAISNVLSDFTKIANDPGSLYGIPTDFKELDSITNGLQNGDLILIAARPSVGKTSFAMNIVTNATINHGKKCAVFSLEMSREQLMQRAICSVAKVDMAKMLNGTADPEEWQRIWAAAKKLEQGGIFVDDSSLTSPADILSKCRRLKAKENIDLVMIDYIQLMTTGEKRNDNRQLEVSEISRKLKTTAKELNVPIIVLSQLSRAADMRKGDHRPMLSDLRDSGAIEQDADMVTFLYNPEKYNDVPHEDEPGTIELIIAKNRRGRTGTIKLRWIGKYTTFVDKPNSTFNEQKTTLAPASDAEQALEKVDVDIFDKE